ncbi:MAG: FAD-dependent oxidoreductase [Thermomicrobiales bacterium]
MFHYQRTIPTLWSTDVLVVGAGSAGCSAAIAAARPGCSVTLVERYGFLGGVSTGVLDTFYGFYTPGSEARRVVDGVPGDIVRELGARKAAFERPNTFGAGTGITYHPETLKRVYEEMALTSGVQILLHTFCTDAIVEDGRLAGVVVDSKSGLQRIDARVTVDCSGDADVAARAGAPCEQAGVESPVQTATTTFRVCNVDVPRAVTIKRDRMAELMKTAVARDRYDLPRLDGSIHRTPVPGVMLAIMSRVPDLDATDPVDLTRAEIEGRRQVEQYVRFLREYVPGYERADLIATSVQIGVRESRRIRGEYWLTEADVVAARRHDDDVVLCGAPIEDHHTGSDTRWQYLPDGEVYGIPYRSLLPLQVEGLLVAGKCLSASHDAHASARNMAQCMAMGQAAGTAAALAVETGRTPRAIDRGQLRDRLLAADAILEWPALMPASV